MPNISTETAAEPPRVFAVDKPRGKTSHDVVAVIRRILPGVKVGHAGTLDPDATGVLVICVGKATKISAFLMEGEKEYAGVGRLGITTDSQDATGEILEERPVTVDAADLERTAAGFVGEIEQVPPMFSAVKVDGQRLYRLARKGVEVERASRRVTVHSLEVDRIELPDFRFVLRCSKGTYVRTILHDIGQSLGCGGHLVELRRTVQGPFTLERAVPWEELLAVDGARRIRDCWISPGDAMAYLPVRPLPATGPARRTGELLSTDPADPPVGSLVRLAVPSGAVRGVGRVTAEGVRILNLLPAGDEFGRGVRGA